MFRCQDIFSIKNENIERGQLLMFSDVRNTNYSLFFSIKPFLSQKKTCWLLHQSKAFKESKIKECKMGVLLSHLSACPILLTSMDYYQLGFSVHRIPRLPKYWSWLPFLFPVCLPLQANSLPLSLQEEYICIIPIYTLGIKANTHDQMS